MYLSGLDGWDKTLCVDPFHAFNVINTFKVALNIQPADVRLYYHYHRDSVFVMHFSCWFTTEALGWSKTSKNLRDRSFESRVEVCLQDLNFFKKYLQSCAEVFKVPVSLTHTPAEIQLISCKQRGEEKAAADGAVWGRRKQRRRAWSRVSVTSAFSCASYHSVLFRL